MKCLITVQSEQCQRCHRAVHDRSLGGDRQWVLDLREGRAAVGLVVSEFLEIKGS